MTTHTKPNSGQQNSCPSFILPLSCANGSYAHRRFMTLRPGSLWLCEMIGVATLPRRSFRRHLLTKLLLAFVIGTISPRAAASYGSLATLKLFDADGLASLALLTVPHLPCVSRSSKVIYRKGDLVRT